MYVTAIVSLVQCNNPMSAVSDGRITDETALLTDVAYDVCLLWSRVDSGIKLMETSMSRVIMCLCTYFCVSV